MSRVMRVAVLHFQFAGALRSLVQASGSSKRFQQVQATSASKKEDGWTTARAVFSISIFVEKKQHKKALKINLTNFASCLS